MVNGLNRDDYLLQLAEESSELSQAATKLIRIIERLRKTPFDEVDCGSSPMEGIIRRFQSRMPSVISRKRSQMCRT